MKYKKLLAFALILAIMTMFIAVPVQANVEVNGMQSFRKLFDSYDIPTWTPARNVINSFTSEDMTRDDFLYTCVVRWLGTNYIVDHTGEEVKVIYFKNKKQMLTWLEEQLELR